MKRLLILLLVITMMTGLIVSVSAASVDLADTGKTVVTMGDWVYEKINGDTEWELDEYVGEGGEVVVPRIVADMLVVQFGNHCFANNTNVTSIITSSPLWVIGEYAFIDCSTLESIELNGALHTIGVGAFSGTSSLKDINLQDSIVTEIKAFTFLNSGIEEVILPETCTKIGYYAFGQCHELTKITIPDSVTEIDEEAFNLSENVTIYCNTDSYAHQYAEANSIPYVLLDAPVEVTFILGDADGDGVVTILDATKIQRVLAGLDTDGDGMITMRSLVDDEDTLNIMHATKIQRWIAGYTSEAPIGEEVTRVVS